ncbi:hypothetical protein [Corynebacterium atypicum]|nr:hypothetical protein [Corynebacterium atypicum]
MLNKPEVRTAAGAIGLVIAGLAIGGIMISACTPGGSGSGSSSDVLKPIDPNASVNPDATPAEPEGSDPAADDPAMESVEDVIDEAVSHDELEVPATEDE